MNVVRYSCGPEVIEEDAVRITDDQFCSEIAIHRVLVRPKDDPQNRADEPKTEKAAANVHSA
jgi:hypothetical protein